MRITDLRALTQAEKREIQASLLLWFTDNGRSFPWRSVDSPYGVLIAEKLLQQTAARPHVVEIYLRLLREYPDFKTLAQAGAEELRELFKPLGLLYRAEEVLRLAQQVSSLYGGEVPSDYAKLIALEGVGEYTARAVLCFGFGVDAAVVDVNVARFLFRYLGVEGALPANPARKRWLVEVAESLIPRGQAKQFNWAILDLCAQVCIPGRPRCEGCPVARGCAWFLQKGDL